MTDLLRAYTEGVVAGLEGVRDAAINVAWTIQMESATWHELHAVRVGQLPWYRIWWHLMTGHRR